MGGATVTKSGAESWCFALFSGAICEFPQDSPLVIVTKVRFLPRSTRPFTRSKFRPSEIRHAIERFGVGPEQSVITEKDRVDGLG